MRDDQTAHSCKYVKIVHCDEPSHRISILVKKGNFIGLPSPRIPIPYNAYNKRIKELGTKVEKSDNIIFIFVRDSNTSWFYKKLISTKQVYVG